MTLIGVFFIVFYFIIFVYTIDKISRGKIEYLIMAVPKRKTTKSRAGKRRSHIRHSSKNIIEDKKSGEYRLSHHMDLKTGFYKGRQVLDPKE